MEIKAILEKPYTFEQKRDFILVQNRQNGYEIKETETQLEAWGLSENDKADIRRTNFYKEFFNTSLGWIRRNVTMKNGTKDFLSDLLPTISMAITTGQEVKIIAYDEPDFTEDIEDWTKYQHNEVVTPQFIQECFQQLQADFGVVNQ